MRRCQDILAQPQGVDANQLALCRTLSAMAKK